MFHSPVNRSLSFVLVNHNILGFLTDTASDRSLLWTVIITTLLLLRLIIKTFIMGDTILRALHRLTHLILTQTLWKRWGDYHFHVIGEETKAQQTKSLPPRHTAQKRQSHGWIQVTAVSCPTLFPAALCCARTTNRDSNPPPPSLAV